MDAKRYRFRVQRRIRITALDKTGKRFLMGESWHTIAGLDYREDADWLIEKARAERPRCEFRLVEGPHDLVVGDWRSAEGKAAVGETAAMNGAVNYPRLRRVK
jgi:hypothetical protein